MYVDFEIILRKTWCVDMNDDPEGVIGPPEWIAVLEESTADIAAGRTVNGSVVLQMIRGTLARMERRDHEAEPQR